MYTDLWLQMCSFIRYRNVTTPPIRFISQCDSRMAPTSSWTAKTQ